MFNPKTLVKNTVFGPPGVRMRTIRHGLLRGRKFPIDTANMSMRLVGLWETEIVGAVRRLARQATVACDVGANNGWYTLYFATCPNIRRIFAIEPDSALLKEARENISCNDPAMVEKVTIIEKFVGDRDDDQWCKLDTVLRGVNEPILFKIDIDGGEVDALRGARSILKTGRCALMIETHSAELEQGCIRELQELGYRTTIIKNGWYRAIVPETRNIPHNRWLVATKG